MSEPTPPAPLPQSQPPAGPTAAPNPGPPNREAPRRPFPRGDRPKDDRTKPQNLDNVPRDFFGARPDKRALDRGLDAELEAAMAGFDVASTIKMAPGTGGRPPLAQQGGMKHGTVVSIRNNDVFIEVPGGRGQGVMPLEQFEGSPPQVGDTVEFAIERYDGANGLVVLTKAGAASVVSDFSGVAQGMVVEAKVIGPNKNGTGLTVEVNGVKGFLPASQLDMYRVEDLAQFTGQKLKCSVIEVNAEERNLIVSRRYLLEQERERNKERFWATLEEGQIKTGIVRSVKAFGAFVDLGGADGLIPIGEMSWSRVGSAADVVKVGDTVEVKVIRLDHEARKIGLSLRALAGNPWDAFAANHRPGSRVTGKVTRIAEFGAFVELAPGIEGLVHVSELATLRIRRVRDVVQEGQEVTVQIINLDPDNRRIGLSLKAVTAETEDAATAADQTAADGEKATAFERLANRPLNPKLRGGIGGGGMLIDMGG